MLTIKNLPLIKWEDALNIQHACRLAIRDSMADECLILTEHEPVITLGRAVTGAEADFIRQIGHKLNIPVYSTTRGGKALWHGPGQMVGYPIINLRERGLGPLEYVELLEQTLISSLCNLGINAISRPGLRGIWVQDRKIGFIGVAIRGGITYHGFAINIENSLTIFDAFDACGISGVKVTSFKREVLPHYYRNNIEREIAQAIMKAF